jgi:hypothetical protein
LTAVAAAGAGGAGFVDWRAIICQPPGPLTHAESTTRFTGLSLPSTRSWYCTLPVTSAVLPCTITLVSAKLIAT